MSVPDVAAAKASLRRDVLARRGQQTDADRARVAATLAAAFVAEFGRGCAPATCELAPAPSWTFTALQGR